MSCYIPDVVTVSRRFNAFQFSDAGDVRQPELDFEAVGDLDRRHERHPPVVSVIETL